MKLKKNGTIVILHFGDTGKIVENIEETKHKITSAGRNVLDNS